MAKTITLDDQSTQFVERKLATGEATSADTFVNQLVAERREQEVSYDRWFREKVMNGIADANASEFATSTEIDATLARWR